MRSSRTRLLGAMLVAACLVLPLGPAWAQPEVEQPRAAVSPGPEWVWLNAEAGYSNVDLQTFQFNGDSLTAGFVPTRASGPAFDVGVGARLLFLTVGARGRMASFDPWHLWSLDGELGLRVPLGRVEPYLTLAGGYSSLGDLSNAIAGLRHGLRVSGVNARVGVGLDVYLTRHFSLGAALTGEVIALSRPGVPLADLLEAQKVNTINEAKARILEGNGSSVGFSGVFAVNAGAHF